MEEKEIKSEDQLKTTEAESQPKRETANPTNASADAAETAACSEADGSDGADRNEAGDTDSAGAKEEKGGFLKKKDKNAKKIESLLKEKEKAEIEKAEIHDKYVRLYSEFDNYRRRTQKEKLDIIKNASEQIILGILPVLDDMERALKYESKEGDATVTDSEKEGILLIYNKLKGFLKQQGLEEIVAVGEPFNVDLHEAITSMPAPSEEEKGKVLDEIQKGYRLNDKVIRFSKVVIYQ